MPISEGRRPNLLYIHSDQHNANVMGCAGDQVVATPHLDGLAAGGVRFTNAYSPSPVCVASRMSMLTGRYPSDIEVWTNDQILDSGIPTIAHAMGAAGYRPALVGRMHALGPDQLHGYCERLVGDHGSNWGGTGMAPKNLRSQWATAGSGQSSYQVHDEDVAAATVAYLDRLGVRQRAGLLDAPFSLSVGFMLPHHPYLARRDSWARARARIGLPEKALPSLEGRHKHLQWWTSRAGLDETLPDESILDARAAYWALVAEMDALIGKILTALRSNDLAANTLIVYSSDHGDHVGEHGLWMKRTMYEESVKVPAILNWPGVLPEGERCRRVISSLDLGATMLGAMGAPPLPHSPGRSLLPLLQINSTDSERASWEDVAYSEYCMYEGPTQRMIRRERWKLVYHHDAAAQLFDLQSDPGERTDLAADDGCRDIVAELTAAVLDDWDPVEVAARVQRRRREMELITEWAHHTDPPDAHRWPRTPEMTYSDS